MAAKTLPLMFACVLGVSFALLGIPTANAITWDFGLLAPNMPLGTTHDFTVGGVTLTAAGFSNGSGAGILGAPDVALFGKFLSADEHGLGLQNDPSGENEIQGTSLVRIAGLATLTSPTFIMDSVQAGEAWQVWGSESATMRGASLLTGTDELSHALPLDPMTGSPFAFYSFGAEGFSLASGNVLLGSISAVPGPIVGAGLPGLIFASGGLLGWWRRRKKVGAG